jgi:hypothetical protein
MMLVFDLRNYIMFKRIFEKVLAILATDGLDDALEILFDSKLQEPEILFILNKLEERTS